MAAPSALILINESDVRRNPLTVGQEICGINSGRGNRGPSN
jgi:hypothetical protein